MLEDEGSVGTSHQFERRADKFKRSSLKKVDSLKKSLERFSTKILPSERRDKIKKSFSPNHSKSPTAKNSSFKVAPMTFNVKKVRDGEVPTEEMGIAEEAHVDIPPIGNLDGKIPLEEVLTVEGDVMVVQEVLNPDSTPESKKAELAINGEAPSIECKINGERSAGLAVPERDEDVGEDEEEEEEEEEHKTSPVETAAEAQIPTATVAVNQAS